MSNWLSRMFTIPRKRREELAKIPAIDHLAQEIRDLAIAVAQGAVDAHVSDPGLSEALKAEIALQIGHAIPVPPQAVALPNVPAPLTGLIPMQPVSQPVLQPPANPQGG